jgi:hypothetical protein
VTAPVGSTSSALSPTPGAIDHLVVPGLSRGTLYAFTVKATNGVGDSQESTQTAAINPTEVPSAPAAPVAALTPSRQVKVTWVVPASNGRPITAFSVCYYQGTTPRECDKQLSVGAVGSRKSPVAGATDSHNLLLTLGQSYTVTVIAINANGEGAESASSNQVVDQYAPLPPPAPAATGKPGEVEVSWVAPASDGGSALQSFTVELHHPGGGQSFQVPVSSSYVPGTRWTHWFTGLPDGVSYWATVGATNAIGAGAQSSSSNVVGDLGIPGTATDVVATLYPVQGATTITFTTPSNAGGTFTSVIVGVYANGVYEGDGTISIPSGQSPAPGTEAGVVLPYPPSGYSWQFTITMVSTGGTGPPSGLSNPVSP